MSAYSFEKRELERQVGDAIYTNTYLILRWEPITGAHEEVAKEYAGTFEPGSGPYTVSVHCAQQRALAEEWRRLEKERAALDARMGRLSQLRARIPQVIP